MFWMTPLMGFCQLALFGGYAIYFPELFPTRLRSTGVSFCYNVGRFVAAVGPFTLGYLTSSVFADKARANALGWREYVRCIPFGPRSAPLRPRNQGPPVAGVKSRLALEPCSIRRAMEPDAPRIARSLIAGATGCVYRSGISRPVVFKLAAVRCRQYSGS